MRVSTETKPFYDIYIQNIDILYKMGIPMRFISIANLTQSGAIRESESDYFLKIDLAANINKNGMFFPFLIDSNNQVIEGQHRLCALKEAESKAEFLCIETNFLNDKWKQIEPIRLQFPVVVVWDLFEYRELAFRLATNSIVIDHTNPKICTVIISNIFELHVLTTKFGVLIGKMAGELRRDLGIDLVGSIIINSRVEFERYIGKL